MMYQELIKSTIPLFPLASTFFPGGSITLNIFEVRYLTMIKNCRETGSPFGIVGLKTGSEIMKPEENIQFATIGTLAMIEEYVTIESNFMVIRCKGTERFRILETEKLSYGLWLAQVDVLPKDPLKNIPVELQFTADALVELIQSLQDKGYSEKDLPFHQPYFLNDCGWVANRWLQLLPLNTNQKEHLLGIENPRLRLDLVAELLNEKRLA